jgi:hypothetical protein
MTQDAYWDDLGMAWTAISPAMVAPRLKQRLRRQAIMTGIAIFAGLPLCLAGSALGAWTIWLGASKLAWFFVTRGIAILAISLLSAFAIWSFRNAWRQPGESVAALIELALLRAHRGYRAIRLGYLALAIAAVLGVAGYQIRLQAGKPPAGDPAEPLALLALLGLILFLLQRKAREDMAKYRHLKQLLLEEPPATS